MNLLVYKRHMCPLSNTIPCLNEYKVSRTADVHCLMPWHMADIEVTYSIAIALFHKRNIIVRI